jgi:hypothetical protein
MAEKNKVSTYSQEQLSNYRNFITNYDIKSDPIFDKSEMSSEITNDQNYGNYCINGACSIVQKGGLEFSNPQTKNKRYISNVQFSDAVKQDKEDWYKLSNYGLTDYKSGDIIQYKNNDNKVPHHAGILKINNKGEISVIDNAGRETWRETTYSKTSIDNLVNSDMVQIMRPGYKNDYEYLMTLKEKNKKNVTNNDVNSNDVIKNNYVYRTGKDEDFSNPKNKNNYTEPIIKKLNDEDYLKSVAQTYNISNKDAQDIIKYTYGVIKQESDFRPKFSGTLGVEGVIEYALSKVRNDKDLNKKYDFDPSTGYAQIKFNNLTADQRIKYDIRKPSDLYDYNKSQGVLEDIIAKNYKYVLSHMDEIKKNHPSLTKENALKFALYMQNTPKMVMDPSYLDKAVDKVIADSYANSRKVQTSKDVSSNGVTRSEIKKKLQLNLDKGSYPDKVINYSDEIFQPSEIIRPNKKQLGGYINSDPFENNIRISKSGKKFVYPSITQQKQEILNRINYLS